MINRHFASISLWILLMTGILCLPIKAIADSDGQVAFGPNFAVFAQFVQTGMRLNVVPFDENKPLSIRSSIDTPKPLSYVYMLIWKQYLFVFGNECELYIYLVGQNFDIKLLKTLDVRGFESVPYYDYKGGVAGYMTMIINSDRLCLYGIRNDAFVNLSAMPKDWKIEVSPQKLPRNSDIGWAWGHRGGAWVPRGGDCVPGKNGYSFCLTKGSTDNSFENCCTATPSPEGGHTFYTDFIITKRNHDKIDSLMVVGTKTETID